MKLGSRAWQILAVLVARAGEIVGRQELMAAVWPDTVVVEANLTVHIAALRQALGEAEDGGRYIVNVPGRGYLFTQLPQPVIPVDAGTGSRVAVPGNLPGRLTAPVGREAAGAEINLRLDDHPLLTIAGPAGVGKTTMALAVGEGRYGQHRDGVWFVDLSPVAEAAHVPTALATVLGLELDRDEPMTALVAALRARDSLLIIDNCEHLADAVAAMVTTILAACALLRILATSRETLNIPGEVVYRLPPLPVPPAAMPADAASALAYPAVRLLVDRAAATVLDFALADRDAPDAALICRKLDGLPLAIEFAAALVGTFGMAGIADHLDDHLRLLVGSRRRGASRHRTLEAALDWSYRLLDEPERTVLRRLAIFSGGFTMEAAQEVATGAGEALDIGVILAGLTARSLLTSDISGPDLRFRLLETTRAFALGRLEAAGERDLLADRHARYYRDYLRAQHLTLEQRDVAADGLELDNIRAALRHALGDGGDMDVALGLAAGALPIWFGLSLLSECHSRLQEVGARLTAAQWATTEGWNIAVAARTAEMFTRGATRRAMSAWTPPPVGAGTSTNAVPSAADILTNWTWNLRLPNYAEMMRLATLHAAMARRSGALHDRTMSAWVLGLSAHHLGDLVAARGHLSQFLAIETVEDRRLFLGHTGFDRRPGAQAMLGATLCQMGVLEEGLHQAALAAQEGRTTGKSLPLCEALIWVGAAQLIARVPVMEVEAVLAELVRSAQAHALESHLGVAMGLQGVCDARSGRFQAAEQRLGQAIATLTASHYGPFIPWFTGARAVALARLGHPGAGRDVIALFRQQDGNGDSWCTPELLRQEALVEEMAGAPALSILNRLDAAISLARRQSALAWEVMAETDRARFAGADRLRVVLRQIQDVSSPRVALTGRSGGLETRVGVG